MKNAWVSGMAGLPGARATRPTRDHEGYWARLARELISLADAVQDASSTPSTPPFFKWFEDGTLNASYNCLDRNVEHGLGDKTAIIFEADDGAVTQVTLLGAARAHLQARQRDEGARRGQGRPRRHLHADVDRGRGRDAGVRAHRRDPLGGVRRLFGAAACATASPTPAR